jgi:rhamnogalacturonyl hydrolase YesR
MAWISTAATTTVSAACLDVTLFFVIKLMAPKGMTWSYNQGVILGGLADMYNITGDASYLALAAKYP